MADDDLKVKKEKAYKFFLSQGKTPAQASAIVGNLLRESNLNPNAVGDGGKAFGLAQWHPDRQEKAKKLYGENWKSFENQLKFIEWELNNSEKIAGEALKKTNSVWEAGRIISDKYERPKTRFNVDEKRQQYVADIHKEFGKTQLTEEDKKMFETSYANSVAPYINQNIDFSNSAEGITFEEEKPEKETEATQALKVLQEKQKEEDFLTELFSEQEQKIAELYKPIEEEQGSQPQSYDYNDISNFVESPILAQQGIKIDNMGYWNPKNWGHPVQINSNNITMEGVEQPLMGYAPETGEKRLMMPNTNHIFNGANRVIETPLTDKEKQFLKEITRIK